jgi:hypothetical protein
VCVLGKRKDGPKFEREITSVLYYTVVHLGGLILQDANNS